MRPATSSKKVAASNPGRTWLKIGIVVVLGIIVVKALSWLARPDNPQPAQSSGQTAPSGAGKNAGDIVQGTPPQSGPAAPAPADASRSLPGALPSDSTMVQSDACTSFAAQLHLPGDTRVMAVGSSGGRKTGFQIDNGAEATQIEVAVNSPEHPVVLMVSGRGPTIWNVGLTANTRVLAVLASGKNRQAIAGLDRALPMLSSTDEDDLPCAHFVIERADVQAVNPVGLHVFRRPVDRVYLGSDDAVVVGDPIPDGAALARSPDTTPESFRVESTPPAAEASR